MVRFRTKASVAGCCSVTRGAVKRRLERDSHNGRRADSYVKRGVQCAPPAVGTRDQHEAKRTLARCIEIMIWPSTQGCARRLSCDWAMGSSNATRLWRRSCGCIPCIHVANRPLYLCGKGLHIKCRSREASTASFCVKPRESSWTLEAQRIAFSSKPLSACAMTSSCCPPPAFDGWDLHSHELLAAFFAKAFPCESLRRHMDGWHLQDKYIGAPKLSREQQSRAIVSPI